MAVKVAGFFLPFPVFKYNSILIRRERNIREGPVCGVVRWLTADSLKDVKMTRRGAENG